VGKDGIRNFPLPLEPLGKWEVLVRRHPRAERQTVRHEVIPRGSEAVGHGAPQFSDTASLSGGDQYPPHVVALSEIASHFSARLDLLPSGRTINARPTL
jgi:hypothetical protein